MLHAAGSLHDLHDGPAGLHPQSSILCAADRDVPDVPLREPLRASSGSVLHDPLRAALRLPSGSGHMLPAHVQRAGGTHLQCSELQRADSSLFRRSDGSLF